jgi:hypothetical protein
MGSRFSSARPCSKFVRPLEFSSRAKRETSHFLSVFFDDEEAGISTARFLSLPRRCR